MPSRDGKGGGEGAGRSSPSSRRRAAPEKLYLRAARGRRRLQRLPEQAGPRPAVNEKLDEVFDFHGVPVVVDKRSLMYLTMSWSISTTT